MKLNLCTYLFDFRSNKIAVIRLRVILGLNSSFSIGTVLNDLRKKIEEEYCQKHCENYNTKGT